MIDIPKKRLKNGFTMPVFGIGTWGMGGFEEADYTKDDQDITSIRRAIDAGVTHIDMAELYGAGHTEELVGKALEGYDRSKLLLVSKVFRNHLQHDELLRAAERSLQRLGTDYLDVYMIHCHSDDVPIAESIHAMNELVERGLVRHIAVSNYNVEQMQEALHASRHPIVANQLQYNLAWRRRIEQGLLDHAQKYDWLFIAWRPIRDVLQMSPLPQVLTEICEQYNKSPVQVAIRWLIQQENVVTLAKCGQKDHLDDALGALGWELEVKDMERLMGEFPRVDTLTS